jgi:hypothetical protein
MVNSTLHFDILPAEQRALFDGLAEVSWLAPFYLAGGTALALHLGHRQSIDFDFFTQEAFRTRSLIEYLRPFGDFELLSEAENTLYGIINDVRISFFRYNYPLIKELQYYGQLAILDMLDIALMKLEAISGRGSKKDFVDLYFLLRHFTFRTLFEQYEVKYGIGVSNHYHLLKSLVYFEDAEAQPMPLMHDAVEWDAVKERIVQKVKEMKLL